MKNKGFVFTGTAFLLVLPAIILAASFAHMLELGDTATSTAIKSDEVYFTFLNLEKSFEETSENLAAVYRNDTSTINSKLLEWASYVETTYATEVGANISVEESQINASYSNVTNVVSVSNFSVSVFFENVNKTKQLGPLSIIIAAANVAPVVNITYPVNGTTLTCETISINGTASDTDGFVQNVSVSTDGGSIYNLATGTENWTYSWNPASGGAYSILAYAIDNNGSQSNIDGVDVTVNACLTCSLALVAGSNKTSGGGKNVEFKIENSNTSAVTITNITITWSTSGVKLKKIKIDNNEKWSGCGSSGANFDITDTTINGLQSNVRVKFEFQNNDCSGTQGVDLGGSSFTVVFYLSNGEVCIITFSV